MGGLCGDGVEALLTRVMGDTDIIELLVHTRGCYGYVVLGASSDKH